MNRTMWFRVYGALTLIELLVVLGVIGVLAAMLLPALSGAREQGRRSHCRNNFQQIGLALAVYSNSFSEYLPSHAGWGEAAYALTLHGQTLSPWMGHQGVSRHRVLGYGAAEADPNALVRGRLNLAPVGLGILITRSQMTPKSFVCASMSGGSDTWYAAAKYQYSSAFPRWINATDDFPLMTADLRTVYHTPADPGTVVTAIIGSYSYRNTPFYSRLTPANAAAGWNYAGDCPSLSNRATGWLAEWTLEGVRPETRAQFMTPPFKTVRALSGRAIAADSFDFSPPAGGFADTKGLVAHKDGYNVLYGDGHSDWRSDDLRTIAQWSDWADPANPGTDNLTISSASSHRVWRLFDQAAGFE